MLMRALFVHIAHEIAGAARIRHSLRPLIGEGVRIPAKLGRNAPRECEPVSIPRHSGAPQSDGPGIHWSTNSAPRWIPGSCFARPGMTTWDPAPRATVSP